MEQRNHTIIKRKDPKACGGVHVFTRAVRFQEDFLLPVRFREDFSSDYFYGRDEGDLGLGEAIILTGKTRVPETAPAAKKSSGFRTTLIYDRYEGSVMFIEDEINKSFFKNKRETKN